MIGAIRRREAVVGYHGLKIVDRELAGRVNTQVEDAPLIWSASGKVGHRVAPKKLGSQPLIVFSESFPAFPTFVVKVISHHEFVDIIIE